MLGMGIFFFSSLRRQVQSIVHGEIEETALLSGIEPSFFLTTIDYNLAEGLSVNLHDIHITCYQITVSSHSYPLKLWDASDVIDLLHIGFISAEI
jgi:hypothetical protein